MQCLFVYLFDGV